MRIRKLLYIVGTVIVALGVASTLTPAGAAPAVHAVHVAPAIRADDDPPPPDQTHVIVDSEPFGAQQVVCTLTVYAPVVLQTGYGPLLYGANRAVCIDGFTGLYVPFSIDTNEYSYGYNQTTNAVYIKAGPVLVSHSSSGGPIVWGTYIGSCFGTGHQWWYHYTQGLFNTSLGVVGATNPKPKKGPGFEATWVYLSC